MNELLLRIEAVCVEADSTILIGVGVGLAVVGLLLWLGGARYSTIVVGLLGAAVGALVGMLVSMRFALSPLLSMGIGAVALSVLSILARNVLVIILATVIFALVAATAYTGVVLDTQPAQESDARTTRTQGEPTATEPSPFVYQSFTAMDPNTRQAYIEQLGGPQEEDLQSRMKLVLEDLWRSLGPHKWYLIGAIVIGGLAGFLLIWFIKNVVLPLCYSVVGTTAALLGAQLLLLGLGARVASDLAPRPWIIPVTFGSMIFLGWTRQLLAGRRRHGKAAEREDKVHED
ncbi:MAG: hypothetical protein QM570_07545 [Planctomycetota bacterium]|jgi:hypothetical protein|nr:hypothetical protein [Planctomycetota bacterium]